MNRLILFLLIILLTVVPAGAKIAVFTDGRTLKVDDAFLEGDRIVLILPDSGRVVVPALRIDRVVADAAHNGVLKLARNVVPEPQMFNVGGATSAALESLGAGARCRVLKKRETVPWPGY